MRMAGEHTNPMDAPGLEASGQQSCSNDLERISVSIGNYLEEITTRHASPDISVGLSIRGVRRFFATHLRPGSGDTQPLSEGTFGANCVFKPMMAAAALELAARGRLDPDASISQYIPELADTHRTSLIRVRHLLTNTAGYRGFPSFPPLLNDEQRAHAFSRIRAAISLYWPGSVFSYENSTTALVGEILARLSNHRVGPLVRELLFDPIGISPDVATAPHIADQHGPLEKPLAGLIPRGGMQLGIPDFLTIAETLAGVNSDHKLQSCPLSATTLSELHRKVVDIPRTAGSQALSLLPNATTTGLFMFKDGFLGYDGMSTTETLGFRLCPKREVALVLGIRRAARDLRRALLRDMLDRIVAIDGRFEGAESNRGHEEAAIHHKDISGYYFGNHGFDAIVRASSDSIQVVGLHASANARPMFSISGRMTTHGGATFPSTNASLDPTFFRYERTGEPCVMIGMTALKKLPVGLA